MKNNDLTKILLIILGLGLILFLIRFIGQTVMVVPPATSPRQIESLDSFELLWEQQSIDSMPLKTDNWKDRNKHTFFHIQDEQVVFLIWNLNTILIPKETLTSFDLYAGEINWQTDVTDWRAESKSIGSNTNAIFIVSTGYKGTQESVDLCKPNLPICENIKVTAYDAHTGSEIWSLIYANMRIVDRLYVDDEKISIDGSAARGTFISELNLDVENGWRLPEAQFGPSLDENNDTLYEMVRSHFGFESRDIVSNYAINGELVFFLTKNDSILWAVNKTNLEVVGKVQFNGGAFFPHIERNKRGFVVATINDIVVVYLGDSEQLFGFRFLPDG